MLIEVLGWIEESISIVEGCVKLVSELGILDWFGGRGVCVDAEVEKIEDYWLDVEESGKVGWLEDFWEVVSLIAWETIKKIEGKKRLVDASANIEGCKLWG